MITSDDHVPASVLINALERTQALINASAVPRTRAERATRKRFTRLFADERAVGVTITLTDEVMRFRSARSAALSLRAAVKHASREGFGFVNLMGLKKVATLSRLWPTLAIKLVDGRVRSLSKNLILDADTRALRSQFQSHQRAGFRLNINVLGEAVLGEGEAGDRFRRVQEMIRRPEVNYVSVKLSAIVSQLLTIDHEGSLERVCEKLRTLYRDANAAGTFVNLDMEEYRDLRLTLDAFTRVLSEPEFNDLTAGVVLQAYLPDAHGALAALIDFSKRRHASGGGAVESELHGWTQAPYPTKADVDASYLRLLDVALRPENAEALRVGVASHNLFHVAWALELAASRNVLDQVDVEMLEGMANTEAHALVESGQPVLLYAPVTRHDDFAAAVAYLVRRLDENTTPDNYLRAALFIARDTTIYEIQERRFVTALDERHGIDVTSRRRRHDVDRAAPFWNEPDGDPTNGSYVDDVTNALRDVRTRTDDVIDTLRHLNATDEASFEQGHDPSDHGRAWYRYRVASVHEIDAAVANALSGLGAWREQTGEQRASVLRHCADVMAARRATTIAVMARDGGKTVAEADPEVSEGVDFARFYAAHAPENDGSAPLGVVLVVPPWNFPYAIPAGGVLAALAAGNAVILKPAPEAVAVANELVHQLWDAGVPRDVLQMIPTRDDECGRHLVTHRDVHAVVLTGSFDTAKLFTSWKPSLGLLAETSGKNALVITASADIDLAVKDLVQSAFGHAGQKCSAASLGIVEASMYQDPKFTSQLVDAVTSLRVGAGYDVATLVGPIIRSAEPALLRALTTLDEGESWLVEPRRLDDEGLRWSPGVKIGVKPGSWSHLNEWFGPVLGIMVAADLNEAISWQNETPYGLTAGLHSLNEEECARWIEHVHAGNLYVNRGTTGAIVRRQPFGGWKRSSVGATAKAGGANYVNALRHWEELTDVDRALEDAATWWNNVGSKARDESGLRAESNVSRYRPTLMPIVLRVDDRFTNQALAYVRGLIALAGLDVAFSAASPVASVPTLRVETTADFVSRAPSFAKVRWLSGEGPPAFELLDAGVSVDTRPLTQRGSVELPRWLLEQSVAVTNHRYGNVHAGPKPKCPGLDEVQRR
jgi:RHH-type proline utilization regulon transcriptional repressor/proline dehydrogenase/delta 1-pyrroline-5-carboxylate dehydrogenase